MKSDQRTNDEDGMSKKNCHFLKSDKNATFRYWKATKNDCLVKPNRKRKKIICEMFASNPVSVFLI